jgi:membrane protease YdiL (CAAX protease family)
VAALGAVLATVLALALVAVQPFRGRRRYRRLLDRVGTDPRARLDHYRRGIVAEWVTVALVVAIGAAAGHDAASIGLRAADDAGAAWAPVGEIAAALGLSTIVLRRPALRAALRRQAAGFLALLPVTHEERRAFVPLALTAGICEEVVYRGFLAAYVAWLWPGATDGWIIGITAVAFGFAHLYQGLLGVVLTGIVGALLGSLVVASGSLLPAIAIHALIDLRIVLLPDLRTPVEAEATDNL